MEKSEKKQQQQRISSNENENKDQANPLWPWAMSILCDECAILASPVNCRLTKSKPK